MVERGQLSASINKPPATKITGFGLTADLQASGLEKIAVERRFLEFITDFRSGKESVYRRRLNDMISDKSRSIVVEFEHLLEFDDRLAKEVQNNPDGTMPALKKGLLEALRMMDPDYAQEIEGMVVKNEQIKGGVEGVSEAAALIPLNVRIRFPQQGYGIRLRELGAQHIDRLVQVEAVALRVAVSKPYLVIPLYTCVRCGASQPGQVGLTEVFPPVKCQNLLDGEEKCGGPMALNASASYSVNHQRILLQERQEELMGGVLPRGVQALVTDDLVDQVKPGSRIRVVGIFRAYQSSRSQSERALETFIEVNYFESAEKEYEEIQLSPRDLDEIKKMSSDPWLKERVIESLAPGIYGLEDVKEALLLSLVGAPPVYLPDGTKIRGDSHILVLGDPGTGKSQLLQSVVRLVPRGIYTSGKGSSGVGLTAAVVRDSKGEFMLEAGAMVLADGGVCLIDEIDKMDDNDRSAIHEGLEQQQVTITKAGIHATLNARCGVIAAGNPRFGKYLRDRSVADNIDLPPTILSRFDLIFIVEDKPDPKRDSELAEFVLNVRGQGKVSVPYSGEAVRKYIAYARHNVFPELTTAAAERLNSFYADMRKKSESPDSPVVITTRQLEGLVRLAKAHARLRLSREATSTDADAAIRLYNVFLAGIGVYTSGGETSDLSTVYSGRTSRELTTDAQIDLLLSKMEKEAGPGGVLEADFVQRCIEEGFSQKDVENFLKYRKKNGMIYSPKENRIAHVPK
ncbi:MAG: minichromosome maintenance protein MCM [Thermoprotei archaeon]